MLDIEYSLLYRTPHTHTAHRGAEMNIKYQVVDSRTQIVMGTYATLKAASRRADKLDAAYGAVRYVARRA